MVTNMVPVGNVITKAEAMSAPEAPLSLKDLFGKGWGWAKKHPRAALGTGTLGVANVAGLTDNDKVLGQGIGTALGAAAPAIISKITGSPVDIGTLGRVNLAMGGGTIGSLFDILRAKKEQEMISPDQYTHPGVVY